MCYTRSPRLVGRLLFPAGDSNVSIDRKRAFANASVSEFLMQTEVEKMDPNIRINQGGLMRCCLSTLSEELIKCDGERVEPFYCPHCGEKMVRNENKWSWEPEEKVPMKTADDLTREAVRDFADKLSNSDDLCILNEDTFLAIVEGYEQGYINGMIGMTEVTVEILNET